MENLELNIVEGFETIYQGWNIECLRAGSFPKFSLWSGDRSALVEKEDEDKWSVAVKFYAGCVDYHGDVFTETIDTRVKPFIKTLETAIDVAIKVATEEPERWAKNEGANNLKLKLEEGFETTYKGNAIKVITICNGDARTYLVKKEGEHVEALIYHDEDFESWFIRINNWDRTGVARNTVAIKDGHYVNVPTYSDNYTPACFMTAEEAVMVAIKQNTDAQFVSGPGTKEKRIPLFIDGEEPPAI